MQFYWVAKYYYNMRLEDVEKQLSFIKVRIQGIWDCLDQDKENGAKHINENEMLQMASIMRNCRILASACVVRSCEVSSVLPLKLGGSGIVNPRSHMNCQSLPAPKALVRMSAV